MPTFNVVAAQGFTDQFCINVHHSDGYDDVACLSQKYHNEATILEGYFEQEHDVKVTAILEDDQSGLSNVSGVLLPHLWLLSFGYHLYVSAIGGNVHCIFIFRLCSTAGTNPVVQSLLSLEMKLNASRGCNEKPFWGYMMLMQSSYFKMQPMRDPLWSKLIVP